MRRSQRRRVEKVREVRSEEVKLQRVGHLISPREDLHMTGLSCKRMVVRALKYAKAQGARAFAESAKHYVAHAVQYRRAREKHRLPWTRHAEYT